MQERFCRNCGAPLTDGMVYCARCGASVNGGGENVPPPVQQVPPVPPAPQPIYIVNQNEMPVCRMKTNRALWKFILFSILTLGIYPLVFYSSLSNSINIIASRYDGRKTMHYLLLMIFFSWMTLGIAPIVWQHRISARVGRELDRRGIGYSFGAIDFWLWDVFGVLFLIGPLIYLHKLCKAFNLVSEHFNQYG